MISLIKSLFTEKPARSYRVRYEADGRTCYTGCTDGLNVAIEAAKRLDGVVVDAADREFVVWEGEP